MAIGGGVAAIRIAAGRCRRRQDRCADAIFNLLPVWQLDGNRGFAALGSMQRRLVALAFASGWMVTRDGLFVLLIVAAAFRSFDAHAPAEGDRGALAQFLFLIAALSIVCRAAA